jgi:hypothetical protein
MPAFSYEKMLRDIRFTEKSHPTHELQQNYANTRSIGRDGSIFREAVEPFLRGEKVSWGPSDTRKQPIEKAGDLYLITAYATTAPSTGDATITITMTTEAGGTENIGTVRILDGYNFSDPDTMEGVPYPVPANAWLGGTVTTANGASGVNIAALVR